MFRSIAVALISLSCVCATARSAAAQDSADAPSLFVKMTAPAGGDWRVPGRVRTWMAPRWEKEARQPGGQSFGRKRPDKGRQDKLPDSAAAAKVVELPLRPEADIAQA